MRPTKAYSCNGLYVPRPPQLTKSGKVYKNEAPVLYQIRTKFRNRYLQKCLTNLRSFFLIANIPKSFYIEFMPIWKQFQNQLRGYRKCMQLLFPSCWKAYNLREIVLESTSTKKHSLNSHSLSETRFSYLAKEYLSSTIVSKMEIKYSTKFSRLYSQKKAFAALDVVAVKKKVIEVSAGAFECIFQGSLQHQSVFEGISKILRLYLQM